MTKDKMKDKISLWKIITKIRSKYIYNGCIKLATYKS